MRCNLFYVLTILIATLLSWQALPLAADAADAAHGWDGMRRVSYQHPKDLFYNYYVSPRPYPGAGGQLYVAPQPVPASVGHTYVTYQPFMPHEYMYRHQRSYYTYNRGSGWTRTNVRYGTCGGRLQNCARNSYWPMSLQIMALNDNFYHPGLRF
jgi:hypothetical protein